MTIEQILYLQHLSNWIATPSVILLLISAFSAVLLWESRCESYDEPKEYSRMTTWAIIITIFAGLCLISTVLGFVMRANANYMYDLWKYNNPNLLPII